jgi:predicted metal-dependent RNase
MSMEDDIDRFQEMISIMTQKEFDIYIDHMSDEERAIYNASISKESKDLRERIEKEQEEKNKRESDLIDDQITQDELFNKLYPKLDNNQIIIGTPGWVFKGIVIKEDEKCIYLNNTTSMQIDSDTNVIHQLTLDEKCSYSIGRIKNATVHYVAHIVFRFNT